MTSKLTRLTDDELTETLRLATSGYPLPASVEGNLRQAFAELQERRKAAMDSEPVAWLAIYHGEIYDEAIGITRSVVEAQADHFGWELALTEIIPLYRHAQSAPVVPTFEEWCKRTEQKPQGWVRDAMKEAYDGAAVAMLQAGNSPVIPDGYRLQPISEYEAMCATVNSDEWPQRWIPVSERMPDETQPVIVVSEGGVVQRTVYQFCEGVWSDWYDMYDDVNVEAFTHWMPLPAAPQEVKGE